ncbi:hypothetical protein [Jeongeupia sp. USM3]|nr:hypothetical protein [Jeongeupia sp. USM3]
MGTLEQTAGTDLKAKAMPATDASGADRSHRPLAVHGRNTVT